MFTLGLVLGGLGLLLGLLNAAGRKWDSPEAQNTTNWIALALMMAGGACLFFGS